MKKLLYVTITIFLACVIAGCQTTSVKPDPPRESINSVESLINVILHDSHSESIVEDGIGYEVLKLEGFIAETSESVSRDVLYEIRLWPDEDTGAYFVIINQLAIAHGPDSDLEIICTYAADTRLDDSFTYAYGEIYQGPFLVGASEMAPEDIKMMLETFVWPDIQFLLDQAAYWEPDKGIET